MKRRIMGSLMAVLMSTSTILGSCPAPIFAVPTTAANEVVADSTNVNANSYGLVSVTEGNILHAWDWKFTDVTNSIADIANAGYSVVQVSPCQVCEETKVNNDWWKLYQPYDYKFGNSLGSEAEFVEMCKTAEKYGISIVVDVVANHMAGTGTGGCGERKPEVDPWWTNDKFHNTNIKFTGAFDEDREKMVTSNIGMPDVATEREDVQGRMIEYLETMLDMGADGFRYDAAKHIGTTSDTGVCKDTFWKNISAAVAKKRPDALVYGEILNGIPKSVSDKYYVNDGIKVTESQKGWDMKDLVQGGAAQVSQKTAFTYTRQSDAKDLITWVENHDTYLNHWGSTGLKGNANYMSDEQIMLAWSTVGARADAQALYFARPDGCSNPADPSNTDASNTIEGSLGMSTKNFDWKDTKVAAVNNFKNAMVGVGEETSTKGGLAIIKRGNKGLVVTNFGSSNESFEVSGLTGLKDGTYKDASGQNGEFTVSGGKVSGNVKGNTFIVLYDAADVQTKTPSPATPTPSSQVAGAAKITVSKDSGTFEKSFDATIKVEDATYAYYSYDGAEWTEIKDGKATVTVGKDAKLCGDAFALHVKAKGKDGKTVDVTKTYTYTVKGAETPAVEGMKLRIKKADMDAAAGAPNIYAYNGETKLTGEWPGTAMKVEGDYYVYANTEVDSASVIVSVGSKDNISWRSTEDQKPGLVLTGYMELNVSAKSLAKVQESSAATPDPKAKKAGKAPEFKEPAQATPVVTVTPTVPAVSVSPSTVVTATPTVKGLGVKASVESGTSFTTETLDVELTLQNATSGTYSVDDGPEKTFKDKVTVKVGQGKIANRDVTLKVTAINGSETSTETYTYKKVFDKAVAAKEQTVVKVSAVKKLNSLFEVVADVAKVAADALAGEPASSYFQTNPNKQTGSKKTISSASDFTEDMIIAQGVANDSITIFRGTHEGPVYDTYAMFGAYDDKNVYIGVQYTNVIDVVDPAQNYPQSDNGKPYAGDIPQMMVFDTGTGDYTDGSTNDTKQKTAWDTNVKFAGDAKVDKVFLYSAKAEVNNTAFLPVTGGMVDYTKVMSSKEGTDSGITYKYEDGFFCSKMNGINGNGYNGYTPAQLNSDSGNWVDFLTTNHSKEQDTFMIMTIPMSTLGVTADQVASKGIGVMNISTFGASGIGSLPQDLSMLDVANEGYSADDSTSAEKEDTDTVTVALARLGGTASESVKKTPTPITTTATPTPSKDVTVSPTPSKDVTPSADVTTTPKVTTSAGVTPTPIVTPTPTVGGTPGVSVTSTPVASNDKVTSMVVNFGAEKSAPQLTGKTLKLEAEGFNTKGKVTYEFAVNGAVVQAASEKATYDWFVGKAGNYTIQVTMADESGNKVVSKKAYTIEGEEVATPTPGVTVSPTAIVPVPTIDIAIEQTVSPTAIAATPTVNPVTEPTATPVPVKVAVKVKLGKASPQKVGTSIKITASASGGTSPYKFTYTAALKSGFTKTIAKNTTKKTVTWKPTTAGTYTVTVKATDANGKTGSKKFTYKVTSKKLAITKLKASAKKVKVKKKVKITVAGTASKGTLKFKYVLKKGKSTKVLKKYSTKKTYTWKPTKKGTYKIIVYAKDGSGKTVKKSVTIKVKKK